MSHGRFLLSCVFDLSVLAAVIFGWLAAMDWLRARLF